MEMLVALAVFALLAVIASQSLSVIASGYARARTDFREQQDRVRLSRLLDGAIAESAVIVGSDDEGLSDEASGTGAALFVTASEAGSVLVWRRASGREERANLPGSDVQLRVNSDRQAGRLVSLIEHLDDQERILALAQTMTSVPKDCRFDAVGRRCLEAPE